MLHSRGDETLRQIERETMEHFLAKERVARPEPDYLTRFHPDLTWPMRLILMDCMMEVATEFRLRRETFHLSVSYVDLYLSRTHNVGRSALQLIGATALWVAAKAEEIFPPKVTEFARSTDGGYTVEQLKSTERGMCLV